VWEADDSKNSSDSESVRSVINIVESPEIFMLSSNDTEGNDIVANQGQGSIEEDTWSSGIETSNSNDPDFEPSRRRGRNK